MISWKKGVDEIFTDNRYSRVHEWSFDGGARVTASASPDVVPPPLSSAEAVDPEEAFVAAISSCHMLWFLSLAAKEGWVVTSYDDDAEGTLEKDADGRTSITHVRLRPQIEFAGDNIPSPDDLAAVHHDAHAKCFIANSVRTVITVQAQ